MPGFFIVHLWREWPLSLHARVGLTPGPLQSERVKWRRCEWPLSYMREEASSRPSPIG
jgi:hypothetical protein